MKRKLLLSLVLLSFMSLYAQKTLLEKTITRTFSAEELVTLSESIPINLAVDMISKISEKHRGKKVAMSFETTEPIGIRINNMYWYKALQIIVRYNNYQLIEKPEVFVIQKYVPKGSEHKAGEYASVDSREVKISAVFFEANITEMKERGINWEWLFTGTGVKAGSEINTFGELDKKQQKNQNQQIQKVPDWKVTTETNFSIGNFTGKAIAAFKFFENENLGDVIAKPSITVRDRTEGKIQIGSDISIKQKDFSGNIVESFVPTGTIIEVTPFIYNEDGIDYVLLKIKAQRSSAIVGQITTEIKKTSAESEVLMLNNEETIIGGLFINEETHSRRGIPILRDLPWWFFGIRYLTGYEYTQVIKKEIIILIKVEIVPTLKERIKMKKAENQIQNKFKKDTESLKNYKIHSFNKEL